MKTAAGRFLPAPPHPMRGRLCVPRYTAFVKEDKDYLLRTWHESTRPKELDFEPLHWRSLKIEAFMPLSETTARVKFVAKARDDAGNMITLKENSRFVKENGRWYYIDGILS